MEPEPVGTSEAAFRRAVIGDVPALLELQSAYYTEDAYPFNERLARGAWEALLADATLGTAWVAAARSQLVGYVVMTLGYSLEYRGRDAFVDELYVAPAWRGHGLGRRALSIVDAACEGLGVNALHLEVETDKEAAQALYRTWGFVDRRRVLMTKQIGSR